MRAIHLVRLEKNRPAVILTRPQALEFLAYATVAPITSTIRGIATEVELGAANGLDHGSVVTCDNIVTVRTSQIGRHIGFLHDEQEPDLARAIFNAFDLRFEDVD